MELSIGDLVKHKIHGFFGIVVTKTNLYGETCPYVCKVEWCESGKSHLIDINFLYKINGA